MRYRSGKRPIISMIAGSIVWLSFLHVSTMAEMKPAKQTELGIPVYPGWVEKRKDQSVDSGTGVRMYKYEYFSDDPVNRIVSFYEKQTGRQAAENKATGIYTITGQDGIMINVLGSSEGVPQIDAKGEKIIKKWRALITIMKMEPPSK
ncbi:MAG: hypothetical protein L0Y56_06770 [Nitrospira sp.]|nr:hypothetical protein [Nitrospira sp.]